VRVDIPNATQAFREDEWFVFDSFYPWMNPFRKSEPPPTLKDPQRIDLELGWAQSIGLNTMRVFLHDLLWQQDAAGFQKRIDGNRP
jgi:hypothetical protein